VSSVGREHVSLRAVRPDDAPAVHRWFNDARVTELLVEQRASFSDDDARRWVERAVDGNGTDRKWAVAVNGRPEAAGFTALYGLGMQAAPELGIVIGEPDLWGHGIGAQAQRLTIATAFDELGAHRVMELILAEHTRARGVVERLGFRLEGILRGHVRRGDRSLDVAVYGLLPEDFNG
jgi:RimJ/RimL family protein N-acetyltransferase